MLLLDGRQLGPISSMQGFPPTSAQSSAAEAQKDAGHAAFFQVRGHTTLLWQSCSSECQLVLAVP